MVLVEARLVVFGNCYNSFGVANSYQLHYLPSLLVPGHWSGHFRKCLGVTPDSHTVGYLGCCGQGEQSYSTYKKGSDYQEPLPGGLGLVHFPSKLSFLLTNCVFSVVNSTLLFAYFDCH